MAPIIRDMEKAKGNRYVNSARSNGTTKQKTLAKLGISKDQSSQWQKLAAVADEEFERGTPELVAKMDAGEGCRTIVRKGI